MSVEKPQYVCAEWDYEAIESNELTFKSGDYIKLVNNDNEDWWEGILDGFQGFFPANRVREITEEESEIVIESVRNSRRNTVDSQTAAIPAAISEAENVPTIQEEVEPTYATTQNEYTSNQYTTDQQYSSESYSAANADYMSSLVNAQLPEGWVAEYDEASHRYYYRNTQTNETSWEFPVYNSKIEKDLPVGWKANYAADGSIYYYNEYTGESSWEKPKTDENANANASNVVKDTSDPDVMSMDMVNDKIQINLPAKKIKKSSDSSIKYEYQGEKNNYKQCFTILCGCILLIYKKFTGSLSEQLPVKYINLRNCQVDKSPKKKKNMLTINSAIGEIVTLYTNNESDVNSWIEEIKNCSMDTGDDDDSDIIDILEKAYAKINRSGSRKDKEKDKEKEKAKKSNYNTIDSVTSNDGTHKGKKFGKIFPVKKTSSQSDLLCDYLIFGGTLEEQAQKEGTTIPRIVEECVKEIEKRGIDTEGIYRLSGNTAVVNRLKAQYNRGEIIDFNDDSIDIPVICSLLKLYFRELKDTLIPTCMFENFLDALRINESDQRLQQLYSLIHELPKVNYDVLAFLMKHLKRISELSDINKMATNNLAIVFGPTLIARTTDKDAVTTTIMADMSNQNRLIDIIITYEDYFFQTPQEEY